MIISPEGKILANAKNEESSIFAEINLEKVRQYKKDYPIAQID